MTKLSETLEENLLQDQNPTIVERENNGDSSISFRLSLIEKHPATTGVSALAVVKNFSFGKFSDLALDLKTHEAVAAVVWKDNTPKGPDFKSADCIIIDLDFHGCDQEMPREYADRAVVEKFIRDIFNGQETPLPNFAYATRHGFRFIWVLKNEIRESWKYSFIASKIAAAIDADLAATKHIAIFKAKEHVEIYGLHLLHTKPFDADWYSATVPLWARDGNEELYLQALGVLKLQIGESAPGSMCPLGGHSSTNLTSTRPYLSGVMCFSNPDHGYIPKSTVIRLAGLTPTKSRSLYDLAKREISRFAPKHDLLDLLAFELEKRTHKEGNTAKIFAEILFRSVVEEMKRDCQSQWSLRLRHFHGDVYPKSLREYCSGKVLKQAVQEDRSDLVGVVTYVAQKLEQRSIPRGDLEIPLLNKLAAVHFVVVTSVGKDGVEVLKATPTADLSRFFNGEVQAMNNSSLYKLVDFTRPVVGVLDRWILREHELPTKVIVPKLVHTGVADKNIVSDFINDLRATFSFEQPEIMIPQYLGYLIQPMVCHYAAGQNPIYFFKGPTHSGKGYLGNIFPGKLYCSQYGPSVCETSFKTGPYEMSVLMVKAVSVPYLFLDEIAYIKPKELKFIDSLATQREIELRVLHQGFRSVPNHLTIAMAAINKNFSDETRGRMVQITLTKSNPDEIVKFNTKWERKTPELLAALHASLVDVDFTTDIPTVPHAREGFGIVKKALLCGLGIEVEYPLSQTTNDLLDAILCMHESDYKRGCQKGAWTRYTPKMISDHYNRKENRFPIPAAQLAADLTTALGYTSTEQHPVYSQTGYPTEGGDFYHIKLTEEAQGKGRGVRRFVYIRKASVSSEVDESSFKDGVSDDIVTAPTVVAPTVLEVASEGSRLPIVTGES